MDAMDISMDVFFNDGLTANCLEESKPHAHDSDACKAEILFVMASMFTGLEGPIFDNDE